MVYLQKLHEQYDGKGLFVYAIAMHNDPDTAKSLNRQMGITYPVFLGKDSVIGKRYAYG